MEKTFNNPVVNLLLVVGVIVLFYWYAMQPLTTWLTSKLCKKGENMTVVNNTLPVDVSQKELTATAPNYSSYSDIIESGAMYEPQSKYYNTQGVQVSLSDKEGDKTNGDTELGDNSLTFNMCSKSCCSEQWPVPFKMPVDKMLCNSKDKFIPTDYMCNNGWQDGGCLCLKKEQGDFINSRGNNSDA